MKKVSEKAYWESRYKMGETSGLGSHNKEYVKFKSNYVNGIITDNSYKSIIELGCGDGNQLSYFKKYKKYIGYDISQNIIGKNKIKFKNDKTKFFTSDISDILNIKYDLVLSLDVIYHLVTDSVYKSYMTTLFSSSDNVCIFSTNHNEGGTAHMTHRKFTEFVESQINFKLIDFKQYKNTKVGMYFYQKLLK